MKLFLYNVLFLLVVLIFPRDTFASPMILWDEVPSVSGDTVTGYLSIDGVTPSQPMVVLVFSDSNDDFNPYTSYALLGPAENGPISFVSPLDQNINYFLPIMVDEASFNGAFNPYTDGGQFQLMTFGQVVPLSGNAAGGGGQSAGGGQTGGTGTGGGPVGGDGTNTGGGGQGNGAAGGTLAVDAEGWPQNAIPNTLAVSDINGFVVGLLNALLKIGIPIMTIFLVYSGLRLVMARGNEKELEEAKKNLLWVIIGAAVLLGAWTIVKVLKGTFDQLDLAYVISLINFV